MKLSNKTKKALTPESDEDKAMYEESNNSQHPEVIACQGEGETVVAHDDTVKSLDSPTADESLGKDSQNPSADTQNKDADVSGGEQ